MKRSLTALAGLSTVVLLGFNACKSPKAPDQSDQSDVAAGFFGDHDDFGKPTDVSNANRDEFIGACIPKDLKTRLVLSAARAGLQQFSRQTVRNIIRDKLKSGEKAETYYNTKAKYREFRRKYGKTIKSGKAIGSFNNRGFVKDLSSMAGAYFSRGNRLQFHADPEPIFAKRDKWVAEARKSVWVLVWAIYDDETGCDFAWNLIQKHKQGIDVRVIVDGLTGKRYGTSQAVNLMDRAGVKVIRWRKKPTIFAMHRKAILIDGEKVVTGGRNYGNYYSHRGGVENSKKWLDMEVSVEGPTARGLGLLFTNIWNSYVSRKKNLPRKITKMSSNLVGTPRRYGNGGNVAWLDHDPSKRQYDRVMMTTIMAINAAKKSIKIHNAYYIAPSLLHVALRDAAKRGVKVELFTNSPESIDVPEIMRPVVAAANRLLENRNTAVCLRRGSTTHSKYMVIDGIFGWVGSYNFHPRSMIYDSETVMMFVDRKIAQGLDREFDRDFDNSGKCQMYKGGQQIAVPKSRAPAWLEQYLMDVF